MPKVYLAGPISGLTLEQATQWRKFAAMALRPLECVNPLRGADLQPERYFNPNGLRWVSMKEIFDRDHHDVMTCDVVLINYIGAKTISRGTLMEVAWAHAYRKPVVCAIERDHSNPNWDVFMEQAILSVEHNLGDAIQKVKLLLNVGHDKHPG